MSDVAILCQGIGKQYQIGERERYRALRDVIAGAFKALFRGVGATLKESDIRDDAKPTIWALRDVSFHVKRGEVLGIIGRNGAGKSTLLKILSRITEPTQGYAEITGRVGSLLEVGTGFHPELTGRENVFLNGAVLGMKRVEIARKFDEIVAFAEVEKFIDTPVKRYSSGMYVRLAFAVAAHMETEILLVDEVLAVGDAQFQKKCLGKMGDVAKHGRTVLLVSHNMASIQSLCPRSIFLQEGHNVRDGATSDITRDYLNAFDTQMHAGVVNLRGPSIRRAGKSTIFSSVEMRNGTGEVTATFLPGDNLVFDFSLDPPSPINQPALYISFDDAMGRRIFSISTSYSGFRWSVLDEPSIIRCVVPDLRLVPGRYSISLSLGTVYEPWMDAIFNATSFDVGASDYFGTGQLPPSEWGVVLVPSEWKICEPEHPPLNC
jgi:lipopolysaccharide transport system ATP-binding protein